jgi:hypothetical protein
MHGLHRFLIVSVVLLPVAAFAQGSELKLGAGSASRLWVEGGSSVRSWKCDATRIEAAVTGAPVVPTATAKDVSTAASHALLTIPVAQLDCHNGTMNEHMRKALKADANKVIEYRIAKWELTPRGADEGAVATSGTLAMAGAEKPVTVELTAKRGAEGAWHVTGSKTLRMTEWGIKPPSLMLGTMKVHDPVTIRFELVLQPK